jgi:hypothetical protein
MGSNWKYTLSQINYKGAAKLDKCAAFFVCVRVCVCFLKKLHYVRSFSSAESCDGILVTETL